MFFLFVCLTYLYLFVFSLHNTLKLKFLPKHPYFLSFVFYEKSQYLCIVK